MHFSKVKGILSAANRANLYRGCSHGCIYCDSRSKCYRMEHDFEDVTVKQNAISLLEEELKRKRQKGMIHLGSMSDPYIPEEVNLKYTKKVLELVCKYQFGISLITKSDLILRDLDIIKKINQQTKAVIQMTLTTYDNNLCRKIEPKVAVTSRRVEVLKKMKELKIPTVVWFCPILPFINDSEENIRGILNYCMEAGVYGVLYFGLTLRAGSREYFYDNLDKLFPGLKKKYREVYGSKYFVNSLNNSKLMSLFCQLCKEYGLVYSRKKIFNYLNSYQNKNLPTQLSLFDGV